MKTYQWIPLIALPLVFAGCEPKKTAAVAHSTNMRQRIILPAAGRDKVLAEMRQMLDSVNKIHIALAANNLPEIEEAARASGMATAVDVDPQIEKLLPEPFLSLGIQTHKSFDALADRMKTGETEGDAIKGLAALTGNCVACHATYRIDERR
jgi:mono/diheme cytochrome c family protein